MNALRWILLSTFFVCAADFSMAEPPKARETKPEVEPEIAGPSPITLGFIADAHVNTAVAAGELGLSRKVKQDVWKDGVRFRATPFYASIVEEMREARRKSWDLSSHYKMVFTELVDLRRQIHGDIEESILDRIGKSKSKRLKEVLTQSYLQSGDYDTVLCLNRIKPTIDQYEAMLRAHQATPPSTKKETLIFRAATMYLLPHHLSAKELEIASGDEFPGNLNVEVVRGESFDGSVSRLLTCPDVMVELGATPEQASQCSLAAKRFAPKRRAGFDTELDAKPQELDASNERVDELLGEIMSDAQAKRFRQLLFQYHVRMKSTQMAMASAKKRYDSSKHGLYWGDVQAYVFYQEHLHKLRTGYGILAKTIGEKTATKICGRLFLPPSVWESPGPLDVEAGERVVAIRKRIERELEDLQPVSVNRRSEQR